MIIFNFFQTPYAERNGKLLNINTALNHKQGDCDCTVLRDKQHVCMHGNLKRVLVWLSLKMPPFVMAAATSNTWACARPEYIYLRLEERVHQQVYSLNHAVWMEPAGCRGSVSQL